MNFEDYILVPDEEESLNEMTEEQLVASIIAVPVVILTGVVIKAIADKITIEKALKNYPASHDCPDIKSFTRKLFTIKPYHDEPDKEMKPIKAYRADKGIRAHKMNKCVCYFDSNDKLVMFYCYKYEAKWKNGYGTDSNGDAIVVRVKDEKKEIAVKIIDESLKKHEDYFHTAFLKEQHLMNKESLKWARSINREKNGNKRENVNEASSENNNYQNVIRKKDSYNYETVTAKFFGHSVLIDAWGYTPEEVAGSINQNISKLNSVFNSKYKNTYYEKLAKEANENDKVDTWNASNIKPKVREEIYYYYMNDKNFGVQIIASCGCKMSFGAEFSLRIKDGVDSFSLEYTDNN